MSLASLFRNLRGSVAQKQKDRSGSSRVMVSHVVRSAKTSSVSVTTRAATSEELLLEERSAFGRARSMVGADRIRTRWLEDSDENSEGEGPVHCMADVPSEIRERIKEDELVRIIRRLETPLRALHAATSRKGMEYPAEELRRFLLIWRQALGDYLTLLPDERSVLVYEPETDESYFIRGRCEPGSHVVVLEPCWTLNGRVVVRGEARVLEDAAP